jgi:hypothetical protein
MLAALAAVSLLGRGALQSWTVARLERQQWRHWPALDERDAAAMIARLTEADSNLPLIVHALADERPSVASAAERGLSSLVVRWERLTPPAASPRAAELASCLAAEIDNLSPENARFAHGLTERLMKWPLDSLQLDAERFLADCEIVLRRDLARTPPPAGAAVTEGESPAALPALTSAPPPEFPLPRTAVSWSLSDEEPATAATEGIQPNVGTPGERGPRLPMGLQRPLTLDGAGNETAVEPRQFLPPRAARITDDLPAADDAAKER